MASAPAFIATPRIGIASVSSANTALNGTGTITTLIAGAASGTRITEIDVKAAATTAAAVVNIFLSSDGGSTWTLIDSIQVAAVTASTTVPPAEASALYANLVLPSTSHILGVTTTIAQATNIVALGGDL